MDWVEKIAAVFRWGATFLALLLAAPYAALGLAELWPETVTVADVVRYIVGFITGSVATAISYHFNRS